MIEVFKTNVEETVHANNLIVVLSKHLPGSKINFDMHDCDKILRVEGDDFKTANIIAIVKENGFNCTILD